MGIPILRGREFTHRDTLSSPGVIVINESMARYFWPKEDAVGRAIRLGGSDGPRLTVVGVVGDVHYLGLDEPLRDRKARVRAARGTDNPLILAARTTNIQSIDQHEPAAFPNPAGW